MSVTHGPPVGRHHDTQYQYMYVRGTCMLPGLHTYILLCPRMGGTEGHPSHLRGIGRQATVA